MKLTKTQKTAMKELALCKVVRRKMWRSTKQLGYTSPGINNRYYDINIASDTGSSEVEDIVLLHEVGHCYFGHNDIDTKEEFLLIKSMCDGAGIPFSATLVYGGPMTFLNIAMDLEINSKLLTLGNIKTMKDFGFSLCTPEAFEIEVGESYRSYYMPLLERAKGMLPNKGNNGNGGEESDESGKGSGDKQDKNGKGGGKGGIPKNDTGADLSNESPLTGIEEIDDALLKEGYIGGETKAKDGSNKVESSSVGEKQKEIEQKNADGGDRSKSTTAGTEHAITGEVITTIKNDSKEIEKFLRSIIRTSYQFTQDPMRLWNRGTRDRSSGIIYNSLKQQPQRDMKKQKLGILVDISGSMDITSIQKAAQALKDCSKFLDKKSRFVTWDTDLVQEFPLTAIPDKINLGGGTDMVKGINYLADQGFTDIVVYSDFYTAGLETVNPKNYRLYSLVVEGGDTQSKAFKVYAKKNKKVLQLVK